MVLLEEVGAHLSPSTVLAPLSAWLPSIHSCLQLVVVVAVGMLLFRMVLMLALARQEPDVSGPLAQPLSRLLEAGEGVGPWLEGLESRDYPLTVHRMQQAVLVIWLTGVMLGHLLLLPIHHKQLWVVDHF